MDPSICGLSMESAFSEASPEVWLLLATLGTPVCTACDDSFGTCRVLLCREGVVSEPSSVDISAEFQLGVSSWASFASRHPVVLPVSSAIVHTDFVQLRQVTKDSPVPKRRRSVTRSLLFLERRQTHHSLQGLPKLLLLLLAMLRSTSDPVQLATLLGASSVLTRNVRKFSFVDVHVVNHVRLVSVVVFCAAAGETS